MQKYLYLSFIIFLNSCGGNTDTANNNHPPIDTLHIATNDQLFGNEIEREEWRRGIVFHWVKDSSYYKNPQELINQLDTFYGLAAKGGQVTAPTRHAVYGYTDSIYLLEYIYPIDSVCEHHPHRRQFVFDAGGHLLHESALAYLRPLSIWPDHPGLLLGLEPVEGSCGQSGLTVIYKYENGELINIFNALSPENTPFTYRNNPNDSIIYTPNELKISAEDLNKDGWNDLVFSGQKALLVDDKGKKYNAKRPFKTLPVRYEFLYFPGKELFLIR